MHVNRLIGPLLALALAGPGKADDVTTPDEDFFTDAPAILTASRMSKPILESPASVSVIDRQTIEASGAREIAELFRLVPGFVVGFHSGHAPAVTYHGLGQEFGHQIQVLIDGRSAFVPTFGGVPWSSLPLLIEDIERIEIIRGPNAVTYGSNAFLATVNIITRHAAEDYGSGYSVRASDNANPDIKDVYLRVGNRHEDLDWRLSLGSTSDDGFDAINDSRRVGKFNARVDWMARGNQYWSLHFGGSRSSVGRGFPRTAGDQTDIERDEEAGNDYFNLQWERIRGAGSTLARLTHTRQDVEDHYDPGPLTIDFGGLTVPGVTTYIDFDRESVRTEFEVIRNDEIDPKFRLVYGGSLRRDRVKSLYLLNDEHFHEADSTRLFGAAEWRPNPGWLLDLGVMIEDSSLTSIESSPRLSVIRKIGQRHALRFVASAAKRNPVLYEYEGSTEFSADVPGFGTIVLPTYQGSDTLDPETIESYEIGLRSLFANGLQTDIKLFTYTIDGHIVNVDTPFDAGPPLGVVEVDIASNDGDTEVSGIELEADYAAGADLNLRGGLSLVDARSDREAFEDSFPDYTAFVSGRYRFGSRHEISAAYYYMDEISWLDSGAEIPDARRLDLRYAYRLGSGLRFELIGQNLLEDIEDYEAENVHDQVIYLKVSGGI